MEKEEENFLRTLRVLVECGNEAFREVLRFELSQQKVTLEQFLSQNRHDIYHRFESRTCCQCSGSRPPNVRKVFQKAQLDVLLDMHQHLPGHNSQSVFPFCCSPVKPTVTLDDLDATLIRSLLTNFGINYRNNSAIKDCAEKLIQLRNKYAHPSNLTISDADFTSDKNEIIKTIRSLISLCGIVPIEMDKKIFNSYQRPLDASLLKQYLVTDLQWHGVLIENQTKMLDIQQDVLKGQSDSLKCQQDIKEGIERLVAGLSASAGNAQTNVTSGASSSKIEKEQQDDGSLMETDQMPKKPYVTKVQKRRIKRAKRRLKESKAYKSASTIQNLAEHSLSRIKAHQHDGTYVQTTSVKHAMSVLEDHGVVTLISRPGFGKTRVCFQIAALQKCKTQRKQVIILNGHEVLQKRELIDLSSPSLIIIEDILSKENRYQPKNDILDYIHSWVQDRKNSKVQVILTISTCSTKYKNILVRHEIFTSSKVVNLEIDCPLTIKEKNEIFNKHAEKRGVQIYNCNFHCRGEIADKKPLEICSCQTKLIVESDPYIGFPQCCYLFFMDKTLTRLGSKYFKHPSKKLIQKLNHLFEEGFEHVKTMYKYVILVYMAITRQPVKTRFQESDFNHSILLDVFKIFNKENVKIIPSVMQTVLKSLEGEYLEITLIGDCNSKVLHFQHQTLRDAVLISYGRSCPKSIIKYCDLIFIFNHVRPIFDKSSIEDDDEQETPMIPVQLDLLIDVFIDTCLERSCFSLKELYPKIDCNSINTIITEFKSTSLTESSDYTDPDNCYFEDDLEWNSEDDEDSFENSWEESPDEIELNPFGSLNSNYLQTPHETSRFDYILKKVQELKKEQELQNFFKKPHSLVFPKSHVSQAFGKYLKDNVLERNGRNEIPKFMQRISERVHPEHMSGLLDGLTTFGQDSALLTNISEELKHMIFHYGSDFVISGLVRPASSEQCTHLLHMDDEKLIAEHIFKEASDKHRESFKYGQYVWCVGLKEQNHVFLNHCFEIISKTQVFNPYFSFFLDGFTSQSIDCKFICSIRDSIIKHGSIETLMKCCRPLDSVTNIEQAEFILIEKTEISSFFNARCENYFKNLNLWEKYLEFTNCRFDSLFVEYGGEDFSVGSAFNIDSLFNECFQFAVDIQDDAFMDTILSTMVTTMKKELERQFLHPYLELLLMKFQDEYLPLHQRFPTLADHLKNLHPA